jgi:cobalt/nickel transport protein
MRNLLLLLAVILLAVIPLRMIAPTEEGEEIFAGADDQAGAEIERIAPDYEPWSSPLWEPPSGEISSLLFALQAAIGAGLIASGITAAGGALQPGWRKAPARLERTLDPRDRRLGARKRPA